MSGQDRSLTWSAVWNKSPGPREFKDIFFLFLKGFAMGIADLIPGVSGGTIAFVTGIYESLLGAVASLNRHVFLNLAKFRFKEALADVHLRVIIPLAGGILFAIFSLARLMHFLMVHHPIPTWGFFFGLIGASILVLAKDLQGLFNAKNLAFVLLGALIGYIVVGAIPVTTPQAYWFIFLCGVIGISAMILPGLSGSFLLLILGKYQYITAAVKNPFTSNNIVTLLVFASGTFTGLLGFSKFLNWLLKHFRPQTMAALLGILIGSMRKVWPWKNVLESTVIRGKVRVLRDENIWPTSYDSETLMSFALIFLGFVLVWGLDYLSRRRQRVRESGALETLQESEGQTGLY